MPQSISWSSTSIHSPPAVGHVGRDGAVVVDGVEDLVQPLRRVGPHLDPGEAAISLAAADADVLDDVVAAVGEDLVEHLGQDERIDDVPL
jgi:hypothetical protein